MWQDHYSLHGHQFKRRDFCVRSKETIISLTKQFPALPEGTLNRFLFHWTTSALQHVTVSKGNPIMVPPRKSWFMDLGIWGERVDAVI